MIPFLSAEDAANLHRRLTEHTLKQVRAFFGILEIHYTGGTLSKMQQWLGSEFIYQEQGWGDLGERMKLAFAEGFKRGKSSIVLIGTDCPDLDENIILDAFSKLQSHDLVLGVAEDGGYYLIGLNRVYGELFQGISWGTSTVLAETVKVALSLGLSVGYLPKLRDIDRPEDLAELRIEK